jgi:hypothetical protein
MLTLGLVLLIVAAVLGFFLDRRIGIVCALVGLVLVVLAVVDVGGADAAALIPTPYRR